jgi:hypothetical protein
MGQVANNPGEFSIGSLNDSTGWISLDSIVSDIAFNIAGTWVGTIALQVSNQSDATKTRYSTVTTYTANAGPLNIPREVGRFVRFICTAYTSGTAYVGFSRGLDANGQLTNLTPQGVTGTPSSEFA